MSTPTELRVYNYEPPGLTPATGQDQNAVIIIRQLFKGLFESDPVTGAPRPLLAESATSTDNRVWTVVVRDGFTFHNGEPVTAASFVDAWNLAADPAAEQPNGGFFHRIEGYGEPVLRGLRVLDERRFEVTLTQPYSGFRAMLCYSAFAPLPKAAFADPEGFAAHPVGNGPYRLAAWDRGEQVVLERHDAWGGPTALTDRVVFRMYPTLEAGYQGFLAGEHDLMDNLPAENYAEVRSRFPGQVFEQASNSFSYLGVPLYRPEFADKRVRQALSLAIDRQAVIDEVYEGQYLPAATILSPNFLGYRENAGAYCRFDPEKARALLAEAGGWPGGTLVLHSNIGGGHEPWLEVVARQLREHLGIEGELRVDRPFAGYFAQAKEAGYEGPFRRAWAPDYAWAESYLGPILGRGGSANQQFWDSPAFDALVARGDKAATQEEGVAFYQQAEDLALEEMPIIPLWFQKTSVLRSTRVTRYVRNIINGSDYAAIEVRGR
ncbi:peptide ABC transporter substrate-binding protein [Streptacidiphilus monticola]|uniref:ABC transporter substrate-binding protein n=1 Tax=Streptacidiphilus monticola TaxID=2161674 RepID=A0ABW1G522_9ACTN